MNVISKTINIENLRCMVDAAHHLQSCGEDVRANDVLKSMAKDILREIK